MHVGVLSVFDVRVCVCVCVCVCVRIMRFECVVGCGHVVIDLKVCGCVVNVFDGVCEWLYCILVVIQSRRLLLLMVARDVPMSYVCV